MTNLKYLILSYLLKIFLQVNCDYLLLSDPYIIQNYEKVIYTTNWKKKANKQISPFSKCC